jgi:hypothetical protein
MAYEKDRPSFTPWDDRALPAVLAGPAATERATSCAWYSRQLAGLSTTLAATSPIEAVADALRRQADLLTWHAQVWEEHLGGTPGAGDTAPAEAAHVASVIDLVAGGKDLLEQVGGLSRVLLPRLVAGLTYVRTARGVELGQPGDRWAGILLDDLQTAKVTMEMFVQALLETPADAERLSSFTAQLEAPLVKAGGLFGPDTLGATTSLANAQGVTK